MASYSTFSGPRTGPVGLRKPANDALRDCPSSLRISVSMASSLPCTKYPAGQASPTKEISAGLRAHTTTSSRSVPLQDLYTLLYCPGLSLGHTVHSLQDVSSNPIVPVHLKK